MTDLLLNASLTDVTAFLGAVAALGTAASGLVDTTKVFGGGVSNAGFGKIKKALAPFEAALNAAIGDGMWDETVRGAWINGMAMDDQIAKAKALIHQGLSATTAKDIAVPPARIDKTLLETIAAAIDAGTALTADQQVGLNRFDAFLESKLRGAYERADQIYRNVSKIMAGAFAVALALEGGAILHASQVADALAAHKTIDRNYLWGHEFWLAVIVGAVAVPLAPIAKDLASSLQAAVKAMQSAS